LKSICVSHKEDVDGIVSAALLQNALKIRNVFLVDYPNLLNVLDYVISICSRKREITRVFICDVGLNKKNENIFIEKLQILKSRNIDIIYIDHHYLEPEIKQRLVSLGIKLIHDLEECTSVQIYYLLKKRLKKSFSFFASAAALTDYMEGRTKAKILVKKYDRTFLMLESCYLSYIISSSQRDLDFLKQVSRLISRGVMPHDIRNGCRLVRAFSTKVANAISTIEEHSIHMENISYFQHDLDLSSSMIVNFVLGLSNKKVGIAYKLKTNIDSYILSIRGSKECKTHLGKLVNDLSVEFNGSGGGHDKACGAVIPQNSFTEFLSRLNNSIE
jgi:RecJ-like exonuclease